MAGSGLQLSCSPSPSFGNTCLCPLLPLRRFLQFAQGTKAAPAARQAVPNTRKPLNFHTYFSAMHAMEAADRDQMLKQSRSKTKTELTKGMQYQAPTSKRRDDLRWEVRMKMQGQT